MKTTEMTSTQVWWGGAEELAEVALRGEALGFDGDEMVTDARPVVMHVLHDLTRAGAQMLVRGLVEAQSRMCRFVVVALDAGGELEGEIRELGGEVVILGRKAGFDWGCARRIGKLIRKHEAAIVHAHQYTPFVYAGLARLCGGWGAKLIFTEHGRHWPDGRKWKRVMMNRLVLSWLVERVTAVGESVKGALVRNEAIGAERIEVIYNGIEMKRYARTTEAMRKRMRGELGLGEDEKVVMQVGGFRAVKDHGTAIAALRVLHQMRCAARLVLVGDGAEMENIRKLAEEARVAEHVMFLGDRGDVGELWHAADVGMLTSVSEGMSLALMEAMATGKAVVATDVGGNREMVVDGETGYLAEVGDAVGLARHLRLLLNDGERAEKMGEAGYWRVRRRFTQERMHEKVVGLYREILDAKA